MECFYIYCMFPHNPLFCCFEARHLSIREAVYTRQALVDVSLVQEYAEYEVDMNSIRNRSAITTTAACCYYNSSIYSNLRMLYIGIHILYIDKSKIALVCRYKSNDLIIYGEQSRLKSIDFDGNCNRTRRTCLYSTCRVYRGRCVVEWGIVIYSIKWWNQCCMSTVDDNHVRGGLPFVSVLPQQHGRRWRQLSGLHPNRPPYVHLVRDKRAVVVKNRTGPNSS